LTLEVDASRAIGELQPLCCASRRLLRSSSPSINPGSLAEFDAPERGALARSILRPQMPRDPHSHQLAGVCKKLDRKDLITIIPAGGGKTGFIATLYLKTLILIRTDGRFAPEVRERIPPPGSGGSRPDEWARTRDSAS
jgi:hypothetical protein